MRDGSGEFFETICLDGESCGLSMSTISDKKVLAFIEELYKVAPFWRTTACDESYYISF
jgi:3-methyladenine DNA glycosylase Tag